MSSAPSNQEGCHDLVHASERLHAHTAQGLAVLKNALVNPNDSNTVVM